MPEKFVRQSRLFQNIGFHGCDTSKHFNVIFDQVLLLEIVARSPISGYSTC